MAINKVIPSLLVSACVTLLAACASSSPAAQTVGSTPVSAVPAVPAAAPVPAEAAAAQSESQTATALEKKFQEAAKSYKVVQRDGKTLYCKREKVIGSTIPTLQCMTESQLRIQVETMDDLRERMRSSAKCTTSRGCSGS
jgi:Skp family chaperone for outer membrane proteins